MLDLGWMELLVIGVVALIVVGPKDLPGMFRTLGQFTAKMRRMAREFSRAMEDAADASGAKDIAKDLNRLKGMSSPRAAGTQAFKKATGLDDFDPFGEDEEDTEAARPAKPALGPHTQKLSEERADAARKIREHSAKVAQARLDAEAAQAADAGTPAPAPADARAEAASGDDETPAAPARTDTA